MSSIAMLPQEVGDGSLSINKRKEIEGDVEEQKPAKKTYMSKAREIRLEQNRKAARESRRRKKVMIEELQRSVIFFSRANGTLKQQNEDLTRILVQAQGQVSAIETKDNGSPNDSSPEKTTSKPEGEQQNTMDQSEPQQDPVLAAACASTQVANEASTTTKSEPSSDDLPQMQPGATMQAMANFQQAATAAMQAAVQGMQGNNTLGTAASAPAPPRAQQIFSDTMAAIAMQQAAAAAVAGQQFLNNPFMAPMLAWQNHQVVSAMAQQAAAPATQNNTSASPISSPNKSH